MAKVAQTYLYQPRYFPAVRLSAQEIADYLDRSKQAVNETLRMLPESEPLRACDLPPLRNFAGELQPDPAATRELAHAGTYLAFDRWGELVGRAL